MLLKPIKEEFQRLFLHLFRRPAGQFGDDLRNLVHANKVAPRKEVEEVVPHIFGFIFKVSSEQLHSRLIFFEHVIHKREQILKSLLLGNATQ